MPATKKNPGDGSPPDEMEPEAKINETKAEKFIRLARSRMPVVLYRMGQIKLLGGPSYEFTEDQAKKIVNTLRNEVDAIEEALKPKVKTEGNKPAFDF